ncbi:hypothetical protein GY45DRAFT_165516 [Cubamyces sp. BRFM 1775]|nr:hypothetical protein GY45DRAFT_165516 [Cubamyces sp. BRFM 1775]
MVGLSNGLHFLSLELLLVKLYTVEGKGKNKRAWKSGSETPPNSSFVVDPRAEQLDSMFGIVPFHLVEDDGLRFSRILPQLPEQFAFVPEAINLSIKTPKCHAEVEVLLGYDRVLALYRLVDRLQEHICPIHWHRCRRLKDAEHHLDVPAHGIIYSVRSACHIVAQSGRARGECARTSMKGVRTPKLRTSCMGRRRI